MVLSQSWLSTFLRCPSLAGRELRGELPERNTDATELGSAWHLYAEQRANGYSSSEAEFAAFEYLEEAEFEHVQLKKMSTIEQRLTTLIETYETQIHEHLSEDGLVEYGFHVPLVEHDGWSIELKGSIDRIDEDHGLIDFKTAGRTGEGSPWDESTLKHKIQADAYTYAADQLDLCDPTTMTYVVATKGPRQERVEWLPVSKGPDDWAWLKQVGVSALEAALADSWPVNHTSHLCSSKWCDAWLQCRGKVIETAAAIAA